MLERTSLTTSTNILDSAMPKTAAAGRVWRSARPTPGWKPRHEPTPLANPRPPALPASLDIQLHEYFAAAGVIGLLAAQGEEPDVEWAIKWSLKFGEKMAAQARGKKK